MEDDITSSSSSTLSYGQVITRNSVGVALPIPHGSQNSHDESPPLRTLDDVRDQVATTIAVRTLRDAETVDACKVGVYFTLDRAADNQFLGQIASALRRLCRLHAKPYLFALGVPSRGPALSASPLLICGSSERAVESAGLLVRTKLLNRVESERFDSVRTHWVARVRDLASSSFDAAALWDAVCKAARAPIDPLVPPPGSRSIAQILADARARLERLTPQRAYEALTDTSRPWPVVLVDIRPEAQRQVEGGIRGAMIIERNVLEWRFDPQCPHRLSVADRYDLQVVIFCQESFTSSLAAASLHDLGMLQATDIIGGFAAWKEARLPLEVEIAPSIVASFDD
ncbi:Rhodanese-like protein [Obba rivulosa]|uniref:Rhodanese-like protein n=1 Tax=Obba rivulosa TaxID=1052685 RepID=A0A8E2AX37_9APHY|nr:Rhodanese-like protein [Obba rivulosa]